MGRIAKGTDYMETKRTKKENTIPMPQNSVWNFAVAPPLLPPQM